MMNPIFMAINMSGVFNDWKVSILSVIKPGAMLVSSVGIAVLAVCLVFQIIKAVSARSQNPSEFQNHLMWIAGILVGIVILSTFVSWGAGFFGG